jgi:hypothetical protein
MRQLSQNPATQRITLKIVGIKVAEGDASHPHDFVEELKKEEAGKDFAAIRNFYEMIWKLCNIPLYDLQQ